MRFFGLDIRRTKDATLSSVGERGWLPLIREPYTGAWQKNDEWTVDTVLAYHAVFACITLISGDIGKLRIKLVSQGNDDIWTETTNPAYSPVLNKPNTFQNHIQFKEWWILSKLIRGNAYALKVRDNRRVVTALYLLDPCRVTPLVSPDGAVFYRLKQDNLAGLTGDEITVPASEIIHDRMNCLFHPLVGLSPLFAAGVAAGQGLSIQNDSNDFFANGANPGGVLTAPGAISDDTAVRLKSAWSTNYTGKNAGKVAVLGDGLHFEPMRMNAVDAQLIEQLHWTAEVVCSVFHVPAYLIGVGTAPPYANLEASSQQYYSQCLQSLIESMELCLDEGLAIKSPQGTELDLDGLLRMDTASQVDSLNKAVGGGWMAPNEARAKRDMKPVTGGQTPYLQQQNYSLSALDARDKADPFAKPTPPAQLPPTLPPELPPPDEAAKQAEWLQKSYEALAVELAA